SAERSRRSLDALSQAEVQIEARIRRTTEEMTTPEIDAMIAAAEARGARASKLCGAGGGGCMITYAEPENVPAVREALVNAGATLMPFRIVPEGIRLEIRD
ncbi:MAG: hypothetical protein KAX26_13040, partial [Anaerolineae bacterium]|nr:hypothetical protein [Anaerolineae bacterium]